MDFLTTHTSLSPIRRGFAPVLVNYKKGCTRLAATSDKSYQLLAHGRWFPSGTPASSTTKTGRHDIAEILLKVALNTKNPSINQSYNVRRLCIGSRIYMKAIIFNHGQYMTIIQVLILFPLSVEKKTVQCYLL